MQELFDHRTSISSIQRDPLVLTSECFRSLSPEIKLAFSYPVELAQRDGADQHHSIEEIVDIAISRCQNLVLDDGSSGSNIVQILDGLTILVTSLHLENSRQEQMAEKQEFAELAIMIGSSESLQSWPS
jgi:hypothetical protein